MSEPTYKWQPVGKPEGFDPESVSWSRIILPEYIAVGGGWLVKYGSGLFFISDPTHENPPVAVSLEGQD